MGFTWRWNDLHCARVRGHDAMPADALPGATQEYHISFLVVRLVVRYT